MRFLTALACAAIFSASLFANDVITLKNGKIIEGEIYRTLPNGDLCVHKTDGNDILVAVADIASRTQNDKQLASRSNKQGAAVSGLGLKAGYVHGFNSHGTTNYTSLHYSEDLSTKMKNGNGFFVGLSYTLDLNRHFYFEPGFQISFLHYNYETTSVWEDSYYSIHTIGGYIFKSSLNYFGAEIPLLFGYRTNISHLGEWNFKLGPSLTTYVDFDDQITNVQLGFQIETGIKFHRNHYVGIGANFCCYSGVSDESYIYDYLKEKRHRLNLTYAYYF